MPRFAANLTLLFNELPFLERFGAAARAGFAAVECQFPYEHPVDAIVQALQQHRLQMVLHNLPAGDWARGERGLAVLPGREAQFREGVDLAVQYARALGCTQLNCLAGVRPDGIGQARLVDTLVANLQHAADRLRPLGMRLLVEPLNTRDVPGFFLGSAREALALIALCERDNILLQADLYHMQRSGGELAATLEQNLGRIGHIQVADNPGRHEPGTGEIHFPFLFAHLDRIGYRGWVGCEYHPLASTAAGLGWIAPWLGAGQPRNA